MLAVEEARARGLEAFREKANVSRALWPAPYDELTPEAAYRWLTECWWTDNEADGLIELVPKEEFVERFCREWVTDFLSKTPLWTEKSRRLVVSWMSRGLETWVMGLKRGAWLIIDQTFPNAAEHLWRIDFSLNQLYDRRPELRLVPHQTRGAVIAKEPTHVILANGSQITASYQDAGSAQGKGKTGITLEELSKYRSPTAFVGQARIVTQGKGQSGAEARSTGGWVNGIANASPNPDWHAIKPIGKTEEGKPIHAKAVDLLDDPDRRVMTGMAARDLANGDRYLVIHYTADSHKRGNWKMLMSDGVPEREWDREMELDESIHAGKRVFEAYDDARHCPVRYRDALRIPIVPGSTYVGGTDGGTTMRPAFVLLQITPAPSHQVHCILEVTSEGNEPMSMFAPRVLKALQDKLPSAWTDVIHVGDGTIRNRMGNTGKSAADIAQPFFGQLIEPMSNEPNAMQSAVSDLLMGEIATSKGTATKRFFVDGGCTMVREGFNGAYKFEQMVLSDGSTMYRDKPLKNRWADPMDALQQAAQKAWRIIEGKSGGKVHRRGKR